MASDLCIHGLCPCFNFLIQTVKQLQNGNYVLHFEIESKSYPGHGLVVNIL